jgi:hypothetical protein
MTAPRLLEVFHLTLDNEIFPVAPPLRTSTRIRSRQRAVVTIAALIFGPLFMLGPIALGIGVAIGTGLSPLSWLVLALTLTATAFIAYHMLQSYQWVELDGDVIRGRRFWTRQYVERNIRDIDQILPLAAVVKSAGTMLADRIIGTHRGYEIRFKDGGRRIALIRGDMTNVQELADALSARLAISRHHPQKR